MAHGMQVFNTDGYKMVDTQDLELKTFILIETRYLSVSATSASSPDMDLYNASQNTILQDIGGDFFLVRPSSSNMYPFTACIRKTTSYFGGVDLKIRSAAAGSLEIRIYKAIGDTEYTDAVNALGANRHGMQVLNTNGDVVFDADLFPPRVTTVFQRTALQATVPYDGVIPLGFLCTALLHWVDADGFTQLVEFITYYWDATGYGYTLDTADYSSSSSDNFTLYNFTKQIVFVEP